MPTLRYSIIIRGQNVKILQIFFMTSSFRYSMAAMPYPQLFLAESFPNEFLMKIQQPFVRISRSISVPVNSEELMYLLFASSKCRMQAALSERGAKFHLAPPRENLCHHATAPLEKYLKRAHKRCSDCLICCGFYAKVQWRIQAKI